MRLVGVAALVGHPGQVVAGPGPRQRVLEPQHPVQGLGAVAEGGERRLAEVRAAWWTLGGLAVFGALAAAVFVIPLWAEFRFYNWQMSVTRKPSYSVQAFVDRASWLPIVHDFFTRQYLVAVVSMAWCLGLLARWRQAVAAERLLGVWIVLGLAELIFHDVGNDQVLAVLRDWLAEVRAA